MDGFTKRTERKRQAIEDAALTRLMAEGSGSLRIEDIAKGAGVSQVTIYNYYGSKQALLNAVIKRYLKEVQLEFENIVNDQALLFPEKMKHLFLMKKKGSKLIDLGVLKSLLDESGELKQYAEEFYYKVSLPVFMAFLEQGKQEGYFKQEVSIDSILIYYEMMKSALEKQYERFANHPDAERLVEEITHLFFYGFLKEEHQK